MSYQLGISGDDNAAPASQSEEEMVTGADILIRVLYDVLGVRVVFGYPGGAILPIYDAMIRDGRLRHYLVRHEQAAGHAAEGFARSTGEIGVVFVTSGPGATNMVTALADAMMDSTPIVCISGQVPLSLIGTDAFQEADITGITRSCTKYNCMIKDVGDLSAKVQEAFFVASSGRPGPVLVDIPKDIQNAKYLGSDYKRPCEVRLSAKRGVLEPVAPTGDLIQRNNIEGAGGRNSILKAVDLILQAERPVIYAGGGAAASCKSDPSALVRLINMMSLPVTCTLMGLGAVPTDNPNYLSMVGMHGSYEANMAMYECDVMLCIGARFDDRVTGSVDGFSPSSKKIHIDIDLSSIDKIIAVDIGIIGDCEEVLSSILSEIERRMKDGQLKGYANNGSKAGSAWWKRIDGWRERKSFAFTPSESVIKPKHALKVLDDASKHLGPIFTTDVGQHQMWAAQGMTLGRVRHFLTSGGLGTMGYGVPAAIGAQVANPDKTVICITGDASVLMNIQELSTIKQYDLPVKIIILNNSYMGMVKQWQDLFYENRYSHSYVDSLPDFVALAESFGLKGLEVKKPEHLESVMKEAIGHKGAVIVNCIVCSKEHVLPMIPASASHSEIILPGS